MFILTENGIVRSTPQKLTKSESEKEAVLERSRKKLESLKTAPDGYPVFCRNCHQRSPAPGEIYCPVCGSQEIQERLSFKPIENYRPSEALVVVTIALAVIVAFTLWYLSFKPKPGNQNKFSNSLPARSAVFSNEVTNSELAFKLESLEGNQGSQGEMK